MSIQRKMLLTNVSMAHNEWSDEKNNEPFTVILKRHVSVAKWKVVCNSLLFFIPMAFVLDIGWPQLTDEVCNDYERDCGREAMHWVIRSAMDSLKH